MAKVTSDLKMVDISTILPGLLNMLNERDKRIFLGALSIQIGYGGTKFLSGLSGIAESTIRRGAKQIKTDDYLLEERIRKEGAGRKSTLQKYPDVIEIVKTILDKETYGDPMNAERKYTTISQRKLVEILQAEHGIEISHVTAGELISLAEYSKQKNQKLLQVGKESPDRDIQFQYIDFKRDRFIQKGFPVISVDTKKKENLGEYASGGREYRKKKDPRPSLDHDFPNKELGKIAPYGVYVENDNTGFVNLGNSHDTPEFAGNAILRWWECVGRYTFPDAKKLMITCDCGGSNNYRCAGWKYALGEIADKTGLEIHVSHYPPGTSKWNRIEHRLFCYITKNWAGQHLVSIVAVVNLIGSTTTSNGLKVKCVSDSNHYELGKKYTDEQIASLNLKQRRFHGEWNYVVRPGTDSKNEH